MQFEDSGFGQAVLALALSGQTQRRLEHRALNRQVPATFMRLTRIDPTVLAP